MKCPRCGQSGQLTRVLYSRNTEVQCRNHLCDNFGAKIGDGAPPNTASATPIQTVSKLEGKFEPEARDCRDPLTAAATSMAVSLKRIADALDGRDNPNNVADTLFGIMMNGRV